MERIITRQHTRQNLALCSALAYLSESWLKLDKVNLIFGCIRLRRHCTVRQKVVLSLAGKFWLVPIGVISSWMYIVRKDSALLIIDNTDARRVNHHRAFTWLPGWENELNYINLFSVDQCDEFVNIFEKYEISLHPLRFFNEEIKVEQKWFWTKQDCCINLWRTLRHYLLTIFSRRNVCNWQSIRRLENEWWRLRAQ